MEQLNLKSTNTAKLKKTVIVVSPHPDDAEISMGGSIAKMVCNGWRVVIADLTDGEPTPLGNREIRLKEAEIAGRILGVERVLLGLKNRKLIADHRSSRGLSELIRKVRPSIMFAPVLPDAHPDHINASQLVTYARFNAKLSKTDLAGEPYWVEHLCFYYSIHRDLADRPSLIIDVDAFWENKLAAVSVYKSQIGYISPSNGIGIVEKMEVVNRYFGLAVKCRYGEPFLWEGPVNPAGLQELFRTDSTRP